MKCDQCGHAGRVIPLYRYVGGRGHVRTWVCATEDGVYDFDGCSKRLEGS